MSDIGFAIGNGLSRIGFDLNSLRGKGVIIGCNRLYLDFIPDIIVAIDKIPVKEIDTIKNREFDLLTPNKGRSDILLKKADGTEKKVMGILGVNRKSGKNSGILACSYLAKILKVKKIYMIGFDFFRFQDGDKTNDIYNDFICYFPKFYLAWNILFEDCPDTEFIRVGPVPEWDEDFFHNKLSGDNFTLLEALDI